MQSGGREKGAAGERKEVTTAGMGRAAADNEGMESAVPGLQTSDLHKNVQRLMTEGRRLLPPREGHHLQ
jgi:hypothetical protein